MKVYPFRFNIYLVMIAAVLLAAGCKSGNDDSKKVSGIRVHIESPRGPETTTQSITVLRSAPVTLTVQTTPILAEDEVAGARVLDTPAGFAVEIKWSDAGTIMLEQYSASNPGKHFVIYGQWGKEKSDGRWLAAPLITHRISDGLMAFTPDMTRDDAYRFVLGLNNVAKANKKGMMK